LRFDPDYRVDLILWREIIGQVTNAIYVKPSLAYDVVESFGFRIDAIHSMAHIPVATPGNGTHYGTELDLGLFYRNLDEGFSAGFQYGVFFPMGALSKPSELWGVAAGETSAAQTLRLNLTIKF
jgi:uncharacterized protein (TIGR04551 family)